MKRLLILLALAGLGATACSSDTTDPTPTNTKADASTGPTTTATVDSGTPAIVVPPSRGVQISNLAAECVDDSACKGAGAVKCLHDLGMLAPGRNIPGGYCTAECKVDDECGAGGSCPIADVSRNPMIATLLQNFGGLSLTTLIPSQCYATCSKTAAQPCARADQSCTSILDMMNAQGGSMNGFSIAGLLGQFPEAKQTFCFPPIEVPVRDAGVATGDAGAPAVVRGIDGGV